MGTREIRSTKHEILRRTLNGGNNIKCPKFKFSKEKTVGLSFTFLLICTLLFGGCALFSRGEGTKLSGVDEGKMTVAEEERARLLKVIDRKFENPDAHFELGRSYQADGLWSRAEHQYNTALSFDPVHRRAQAAMVRVLIGGGETAKSELSADIYMNQVGSSAAESLKLALAFQREQLDEYALNCYEQALRLAPNSAKINRQIGYYHLSRNDRDRARDYLSRSFHLNPNQPEVAGELGRLGVAVRIQRKTEKSTKKLERIVEQSDKGTEK